MSRALAYLPVVVKAILTFAFVAAGGAKLASAEMMVATFEAIGLGQWFRYVTGAIEVGSAIMLWVPSLAFVGAGLLVCTMIGAIIAHIAILGPSFIPALILGVLAAYVAWISRPSS